MRSHRLLTVDLDYFLERMEPLAPLLDSQRILMTGGTGFFGTWLVECFLHLNARYRLGASITLVTRHPDAFLLRSPHLAANAALSMVQGDVRHFAFPPGRFTAVLHAATDSVVAQGSSAHELHASIVTGTSRVLDFAQQARAERLLFVSSGAVYGPQPRTLSMLREDDPWQPDESAYCTGKRLAENLCLAQQQTACVLARAFAFLGPHLPLRAHFAAGNFLADALDEHDVHIAGDGTPIRSYLYAADLAVWLWTLLLRGTPGRAYNVGSDVAVSIRELAERTVAVVDPALSVRVAQPPPPSATLPARYVPSIERARRELGLSVGIPLDEAIRRSAAWHRLG